MKTAISIIIQNRISPIVLMIFFFFISCSSIDVIKDYNKKGYLREIKVIEKDNLKYNIVFEYDNRDRVIKICKFIPSREKPVVIRRYKYNRLGKLRLQYFKGLIPDNNSTVKDIWVESFFYNKSSNLIRIETAFKSSYSISRNKTPYKTTRYYYDYIDLKKVKINGGTYKKEIALFYKDNSLSRIEYKLLLLNRKTRRFELKKDLHFFYKKSLPVRFEDLINKSKITSEGKIRDVLQEEEINTPLKKLKYSSNFKYLLHDLEKAASQ